MKYWRKIVCAFSALILASCSQSEREEEPDYDSMVFQEESEEEEWMTDEFKDRKIVAQEGLEPQEQILIEPMSLDLERVAIE